MLAFGFVINQELFVVDGLLVVIGHVDDSVLELLEGRSKPGNHGGSCVFGGLDFFSHG